MSVSMVGMDVGVGVSVGGSGKDVDVGRGVVGGMQAWKRMGREIKYGRRVVWE